MIKVTKKQEIINDVPSKPDFDISHTNPYTQGQLIHSLSLEELRDLADQINTHINKINQ